MILDKRETGFLSLPVFLFCFVGFKRRTFGCCVNTVDKLDKIIKGCIKNDRKSQFLLYDHCFDSMMSICIRYEKDQDMAMEILNAAFMKILRSLNSYKKDFPFKPWYTRITVNEAIDFYRKKNRRMQVVRGGTGKEKDVYGEESGQDWIEDEYLENMLKLLKESERTVFNLYAIDGYSHREISELLDISERSSIRHLGNARDKLQEMLRVKNTGIKKA